MNVVVAVPKSKVLGSITGGNGRDTGGDWPISVVIGPKAKDCGRAGAEPEIGRSFPCDADGSTMVVGMGGGMRGVEVGDGTRGFDAGRWPAGGTRAGGCDGDGVMPVCASAPFVFSEIG